MSWHSQVPRSAVDSSGQTWKIHRVWPDRTVGDYILEVIAPGQAGVRGGVLCGGAFELLPTDDPGLPSLRAEARRGELVSYRPHLRAVVRTDAGYIKVFPPAVQSSPRNAARNRAPPRPRTFTVPRCCGTLRTS